MLPGRKIAAHDRDVGAVDRKHVVDDRVEERAVVADEDKAALRLEVAGERVARRRVEVVCRFVDQKKAVFADEQDREQHLGAFAPAQRRIGAVERALVHLEQVQLAREAPQFKIRIDRLRDFQRRVVRVFDFKREILELHGGGNAAAVVVFPAQ